MQLPQLVLQSQETGSDGTQEHNNPLLTPLYQRMSAIKNLYAEFITLYAKEFALKDPNSGVNFFSAQLQQSPSNIAFATGFMKIMSIVSEIDSTNLQSILQDKLKIFQLVTNCERHFFEFNQQLSPSADLIKLICKISFVFTDIKRLLNQLGLYDVPSFDLNQAASANLAAQVHSREDATESDEHRRGFKGRRIQ